MATEVVQRKPRLAKFALDDDNVVVIIGSGAGGGTLGHALAEKGVRVVCLEAGQRLDHLADFANDEATMFAKLTWLDKRSASGNWNMAGSALPAWTCKSVGGTSIHWAGTSLRIRPHEFRARTTYGAVAEASLIDWPITEAELAPYYDRAEQQLGVTGTHGIPDLPANNNYLVFAAGAKKLGYTQVSNSRMAINSRARDGRGACLQLGFCFAGCKMGAKWSTLYAEIPKAEVTGRYEVRPQSTALHIQHDASGKITGVLYIDQDGKRQLQKARVVALAANSIESARLLLNSASPAFPNGLANSSGEVGRNYMRHVFGFVYAWFEKPVHFYRGSTCAGNIQDENKHDPARGFVAGYHLQTIAQHPVGMARAISGARGWGLPVSQGMDRYDHMAGLMIVGEDMPRSSNRVTLNGNEKDAHGLPIPNVHYDDHPNNVAMRAHAHQSGTALYQSLGALDVMQVMPPPATHNLGTNRMSRLARDGVVNGYGQSHDIKNLFISDGSQFPTASAENPTLTIVALALRQADYIAQQLAAQNI
jgi:choline dehydrogenase-like flavoprotein